MKSKHTILYLNDTNNPVDLESLDDAAGKIKFSSLYTAVKFILKNKTFIIRDGSYVTITPTYHAIQKQIKRYGYFKAYTYLNDFKLSFMIRTE